MPVVPLYDQLIHALVQHEAPTLAFGHSVVLTTSVKAIPACTTQTIARTKFSQHYLINGGNCNSRHDKHDYVGALLPDEGSNGFWHLFLCTLFLPVFGLDFSGVPNNALQRLKLSHLHRMQQYCEVTIAHVGKQVILPQVKNCPICVDLRGLYRNLHHWPSIPNSHDSILTCRDGHTLPIHVCGRYAQTANCIIVRPGNSQSQHTTVKVPEAHTTVVRHACEQIRALGYLEPGLHASCNQCRLRSISVHVHVGRQFDNRARSTR